MLIDSNPLRVAVSGGLLMAGLAVVWLSFAPTAFTVVSLLVLTVLTAVLMATALFKHRGRDAAGGATVVTAPIPRRGPRGSGD